MTVNKRLNKLIWRRYTAFIALIIGAVIGMALATTSSTIDMKRSNERDSTYQTFVAETKADAKEEHEPVGSLDQAAYQKYQQEMGATYEEIDFNSNSFMLFCGLGLVVLGLFTNLYDLKTNYNEFLFSSPFSRRGIFWRKVGLIFGTAFLSIVVCSIINIVAIKVAIPSEYMKVSQMRMLILMLQSLAPLMALYGVGLVIGILVRPELLAILTTFGFLGSTVLIEQSIYNPTTSAWNEAGIYLILGVMTWLIAAYYFNKLSLEHNNPYLQFDYLKIPALIVTTGYVAFVIGFSLFSETNDLKTIIWGTIISGIIAFITAYIVIFRPQSVEQKLQRIFSKNKA
ncbi:hypothetical protein ACVQ8P_02065 [Dellaglioa sp. BT-FLS60]